MPALTLRVPPLSALPARPCKDRKRPSARTSTRGVSCQLCARYGPHVKRARSAFSVARPALTPISQPRKALLFPPTGMPRPASHKDTSRNWQLIPWQPLAPPSLANPARASQRPVDAAASAVTPANGPTTCTLPNSADTSAASLVPCAIAGAAITAARHSARPRIPKYEEVEYFIPKMTSAEATRSPTLLVTAWALL